MKYKKFIILALLTVFGIGETLAQEITFSKEIFKDPVMSLPYRKATIPGYGDETSLVIYLHGGSSKGNDNETQMQEPAIENIATYLADNNRKAIMLVPQCPTDKSWIGTTLDVLANLLKNYIDRGVVSDKKVYIFGGSMGGTGTWSMLSNYSDLFAAAMPVAGNPTGLNAEAVAKVPVYTVMGTADVIMKISNVETFLAKMDDYDAEYQFDIENGWTHQNVCEKSYTNERLAWVFKHTKSTSTGITSTYDDGSEIVNVVWYSLNGQKLSAQPAYKGIYIKRTVYSNGKTVSEKCYLG